VGRVVTPPLQVKKLDSGQPRMFKPWKTIPPGHEGNQSEYWEGNAIMGIEVPSLCWRVKVQKSKGTLLYIMTREEPGESGVKGSLLSKGH